MSDIPMKLCTGPCGQEYPATAKYWYKHASGKYGLDPKCKKCKNAKQKDYQMRPEAKERRRSYRSQSKCQKRLQKVKGKHVYHVEHTFPLSRVAGTDVPANSIDYLVLACHTCNLSKHDKFPWEWPEGGRLL